MCSYSSSAPGKGVQKIEYGRAKLRIVIEDDVLVVGGFLECLPELLYDPFPGGMLGAVEVER